MITEINRFILKISIFFLLKLTSLQLLLIKQKTNEHILTFDNQTHGCEKNDNKTR